MNGNYSLSDTEILILCGGMGTRLQSVVKDLPKPMAPIGNKPFLEYIIEQYTKIGFINFCFLTGYRHEVIEQHFMYRTDIKCRFSHESSPLGTAGAIRQAVRTSSYEHFICLNGDSFVEANIKDIYTKYKAGPPHKWGMVLTALHHFDRYGTVETNPENYVTSFKEKQYQDYGYINAGIYFFNKTDSLIIDEKSFSLEIEVFPRLVAEKALMAFPAVGNFIDIGIPEDYKKAQTDIPKWVCKN